MRHSWLLLLPLAACGGLPQPFFNNPGLAGMRLSEPPASRLAVPTPAQSLLTDQGAETWARATAEALVEQEIPAAPGASPKGRDWTLRLTAELRGNSVVPSYAVLNPRGEPQGTSEAAPVDARAWANGDAGTLKAAAAQAAPGIATLLNTIEAARRQSDPNSLVNRPARVYMAGVVGAPGDGDRSLPSQLRLKMTALGLVVQDTAKDADYKVQGEVQTAAGAGGTLRVELQWIVSDARSERGRIVQINEVAPRSVQPYWGDTAAAVATEAAAGVRQVITNASGIAPKT